MHCFLFLTWIIPVLQVTSMCSMCLEQPFVMMSHQTTTDSRPRSLKSCFLVYLMLVMFVCEYVAAVLTLPPQDLYALHATQHSFKYCVEVLCSLFRLQVNKVFAHFSFSLDAISTIHCYICASIQCCVFFVGELWLPSVYRLAWHFDLSSRGYGRSSWCSFLQYSGKPLFKQTSRKHQKHQGKYLLAFAHLSVIAID